METHHVFGSVIIPVKEIPFVYESIPFGIAKRYPVNQLSTNFGTASLKMGLKLLKQRNPVKKLVRMVVETFVPPFLLLSAASSTGGLHLATIVPLTLSL